MVFHHVNCKADKFTAGARQSLCLELTSNCLHYHLRDAHLCRVHSLSVVCFIMKSLPRSGGKYLLRHVLVFCSSNAFFFLLFVSVLLTRCISALVRLWCFFFIFLVLSCLLVKIFMRSLKEICFLRLILQHSVCFGENVSYALWVNPSSISLSAKHFVLLRWKLYIF